MFDIFSFLGFGGRPRGQIFKIKGRNSTLMLERCYCLLNMFQLELSEWSEGGKKQKKIFTSHTSVLLSK